LFSKVTFFEKEIIKFFGLFTGKLERPFVITADSIQIAETFKSEIVALVN